MRSPTITTICVTVIKSVAADKLDVYTEPTSFDCVDQPELEELSDTCVSYKTGETEKEYEFFEE